MDLVSVLLLANSIAVVRQPNEAGVFICAEVRAEQVVYRSTEGQDDGAMVSKVRQLGAKRLDVVSDDLWIVPEPSDQLPRNGLHNILDDVGHVRAPEVRARKGMPDFEIMRRRIEAVKIAERFVRLVRASMPEVEAHHDHAGIERLEERRVQALIKNFEVADF